MLGLARGTVQLFPHDPDWETEGKRLSDQLSQILGSAAVDVRHIGSTAIRTAEAKPILDLAVAARNLPEIDCAIPKLKSAGFLHHAENDDKTQRFFCVERDGLVLAHIHAVQAGGQEWRDYNNFRDYMNAFPEAAALYSALKLRLCAQFSTDRSAYTEGKADFIRYALRKAMIYSFLGKTVSLRIDRPIGYVHRKGEKVLVYPINYGYIPGVLGGDGEELDVYVIDSAVPESACSVRIIGAVHRENDVEDKLIGSLSGKEYASDDIARAIDFQEQYYSTKIQTLAERNVFLF